jgi:hypothetical protein
MERFKVMTVRIAQRVSKNRRVVAKINERTRFFLFCFWVLQEIMVMELYMRLSIELCYEALWLMFFFLFSYVCAG